MTDKEIYELVRKSYADVNKDYITEMVRVAKRRIADGEDIETILAGWPKLSEEEKQEIRDAV